MAKRGGAVHVATTRRTYKGKTYATHLIRRSYREGGKVKHQTLANLSHLPDELIGLIRRFLAGERFVPASGAFRTLRNLPYGHVRAVLGTIRKLGLDTIIASKRCRERDLILALIAERILHPTSKLGTVRLWKESVLGEELGVAGAQVNEVYKALDWLYARQGRIEKKLAARHLREGCVALYDVSTSYYEGSTCPLAKFGHNRDGDNGCPVIVYGMLQDPEGRPIGMDVYEGNTGDPSTVPDQVSKLRRRFGLSRVILVGDRGMLTQAKIEALKAHPGLGWVSALRSGAVKKLVNTGCLQMTLFDEVNLAEILSPDFPGERLMACFNPALAEERGRKREALLAATEAGLSKIARTAAARTKKPLTPEEIGSKVGRVINRHKMAKHFTWTAENGRLAWARDEQSIRQERDLDGIYIVRTSEPPERLDAQDAVRVYKSLSLVEQGFRRMKGPDLLIRPIWLSVPPHVRAHFLLCMLAYYAEWHMRGALAPLLFDDEELPQDRWVRDPVSPAKPSRSAKVKKARRTTTEGLDVHSFQTLLEALATQCKNLCSVESPGGPSTFTQITDPTPLQAKAYQLLGL